MKQRIPLLLLSTILITTACAPMGGPNRPDRDPPERRDAGGVSSSMVISDLQERLQHTERALQLTPDQHPLWSAYQDKVGALMADQLKPTAQHAQQTAPQQIAQKVATISNRLTAMEDIQAAANALYAGLDEPQQQTADRMLPTTVPTLYSGLEAGATGERRKERRDGQGGRGSMGGGGRM